MIEFINKYLIGITVPILLIIAGIFYTVLLKCFHITKPKEIIRAMLTRDKQEGVSPFGAVTVALAGTLGVGNIVGVAAAIGLGGFGAIFWMWISALCAMLLKYAEIVLAMLHRRYDKDGEPHGAAVYYILDFFSSLHLSKLGGIIAGIFAILSIINAITMGSMIQANAVAESFEGVWGLNPVICGIILSVLVGSIIFRGTRSIAKFTEILVPIMSLGYIVISLAAIIVKKDMIATALSGIISDAFSLSSAAGGILGFILSRSLRFGAMRGLISNEAGCGTAPTAHSISNSESAVEQGFWGIFEVFTDTIILCTMTALVIIINYDQLKYRGSWIMLTIDAYSSVFGNAASVFLNIAVLCFGFATIVCWAHYGIESIGYFTRKKAAKNLFIIVYCISTFSGAFTASEAIWNIADLAIGFMTLINTPIICFMSQEVKKETVLYFHNN